MTIINNLYKNKIHKNKNKKKCRNGKLNMKVLYRQLDIISK